MKLICALIISIFALETFGLENAELGVSSKFINNAFYKDESVEGDLVFGIEPELNFGKGTRALGGNALNLASGYYKYMSFNTLDYYTLDIDGQWSPFGKSRTELLVLGEIKRESEPAVDKFSERVNRFGYGAGTLLRWKLSSSSSIHIWGNYKMEVHDEELYTHLNSYEIDGGLKYYYRFLPETFIVTGIEGGQRTYPEGKNPDETLSYDEKLNSQYFYPHAGVEGRLSTSTTIIASAGYLFRYYEEHPDGIDSPNFTEPTFRLKFEEQLSPRDILTAGYDYDVYDSYYTNFLVDQTIYLGYGRILGDRILFLTRLSYSTLSFSLPNRREDQRLLGNFNLEYSLSTRFKIAGEFMIDFLNSDARENGFTNGGNFSDVDDPAMSYQYYHLGVSGKYIF